MSDDFRPVNRVYHLTGDFSDPVRVWNDFLAVVNATAGVKIVGAYHHVFPFYQTGCGLSGIVMLSESHAAIHTWPEHRYASVTLSSCGGVQSVQSFGDQLKAQWPDCAVEYQETCVPGQSLLIETEGPVMAQQTRYQHLELFRSAVFGKVMALDGIIQVTELDAFVYHEALCLVPLALHPDSGLDVLVVGGGDGYSLATVLQDPAVRSVAMIDIDREVVASAAAWFGNADALSDPRVRVVYDDALAWLEVEKARFDVIVVDLTDPAEERTLLRRAESPPQAGRLPQPADRLALVPDPRDHQRPGIGPPVLGPRRALLRHRPLLPWRPARLHGGDGRGGRDLPRPAL